MTTFEGLLITGGAGFVGSNLAVLFRERCPHARVIAFDNLRRRGSELNLPRLRQAGVEFVHGDVRSPEDFSRLPAFDLLIDCSAEPSVHAGSLGSPREVLNINLLGTINCLETARTAGARFLFLSTSRVYPIGGLNEIPWKEEARRFCWEAGQQETGVSDLGICEDFPLAGPRSFYGASKLASELLIQEYNHTCSLPALINRCGIITGPWQMGKVDQGVVTLWVARHHFKRPLRYTGFGGSGKQVRDLLHIEDLFELLLRQIESPHAWDGRVYNVGGGPQISVSLRELTDLCQNVTRHSVDIAGHEETNPLDVRIYLTDASRAARDFNWHPQKDAETIVRDIHDWIRVHESDLAPLLAEQPGHVMKLSVIVPAQNEVTVIEPPMGKVRLNLGELWLYRDLLVLLIQRDVSARYRQSIVGYGWAVIKPVLSMVIFTVIFGWLAQMPSDDAPYAIFSFSALLPWMYFSGALASVTNSVVAAGSLLNKVYFPRLILPLTGVAVGLAEMAIQGVILGLLMAWYRFVPGWQIALVPLWVLMCVVTALAFGLWLTALNVKYRDVGMAVPFILQVWMYLCPIIYPISIIPDKWRILYGLNPMVGVIEGFRWSILGTAAPDWTTISVSFAAVNAIFVGGLYYFRTVEATFADVI